MSADSALSRWRAEKDAFFRAAGQSPLTQEQIGAFEGLQYFPEDPALRFSLTVEEYPNAQVVTLQTSTGVEASYLRWGQVRFAVDGRAQTLTLFRDAPQGAWFLPLRDATSGGETYGAGRYLEVEPGADGTAVILDFNYAYNPYCAYNPDWTCPIPPAENTLTVPVRAGERAFHV